MKGLERLKREKNVRMNKVQSIYVTQFVLQKVPRAYIYYNPTQLSISEVWSLVYTRHGQSEARGPHAALQLIFAARQSFSHL